ncbi:hypothetical protein EJ05DRAFT_496818 [Pseudovirgaria hyperparasitica]|uniref:DUF6604 domain-containing protein n=1 Tax=Pseudovirgaria hyperparasitica TaxID=470096 RepID=A0A6A6WJY6_9PEZI|nr:uncharacterized protein EJ05DRAFT_496818 [Pseudovirgaria hyperparasitica]KAF2761931.1 hypothetical protein EJ05DRAFT_496818 [Pseudovirgaria hyperparasitica]
MAEVYSTPLLTPELHEKYMKYKEATEIVTTWVALNGRRAGHPIFDATNCSIDVLVRASKAIFRAGITVPPEIYWALKDAIRDRISVMKHYGDNDTGHIKFIKGLSSIYRSLFPPSKGGKSRQQQENTSDEVSVDDTLPYINEDDEMGDEVVDGDHLTPTSHDMAKKRQFRDRPSAEQYRKLRQQLGISGETSTSITISDDPILKEFKVKLGVINTVFTADTLCETLKGYWKACNEGSMSIFVAAMLTSTAVKLLSLVEVSNKSRLGIEDHVMFVRKMSSMGEMNPDGISMWKTLTHGHAGIFSTGWGFYHAYNRIVVNGGSTKSTECASSDVRMEKAATLVPRMASHTCQAKYILAQGAACESILNSILTKQVSCTCTKKDFRTRLDSDSPLQHEIGTYWRGYNVLSTTAVFGLQIMLETHEAYLWHNSETPHRPSCLSKYLKFAKDVQSYVTKLERHETLRDADHDSLVRKLECLSKGLKSVLVPKPIDLYSQAPWTAGAGMICRWFQIQDLGTALCGFKGVMTGVMHLYNCLVQSSILDRNAFPLLEALASVLEPTIFVGSRPKHNFLSHHEAALGGTRVRDFGRLWGNQSRGADSVDSSSRKLGTIRADCHVCPNNPRAYRVYGHASMTFLLVAQDFHPNAKYFCRVQKLRETPGNLDRMRKLVEGLAEPTDGPLGINPALLNKVKEILEADLYEQDLPFARINWIKVYLACCDALLSIAEALRAIGFASMECCAGCPPGPSGLEYVKAFLETADAIQEGENLPVIGYDFWASGTSVMEGAFRKAFGGYKNSEFLWDI